MVNNAEKVEEMVEKSGKLTKAQFEVMNGLSRFLTISEIADYRKTSRTSVYKHLDTLIQKGLLRKIGKAHEITDSGKEQLHSTYGFKNQFRLHNLAVRTKILSSKKNWDMRKNQIVNLKAFTKQFNLKSGSNEIFNLANIKVKTTPQSIITYLPSTYGKPTEIALKQALDIFFEAIPKIENLFKVILIKDRKLSIDIISQHYAKLNDDLAKIYHKEGNKLYITGEDEKVWLIADCSFKTDELEAIHTIRAQDDITTVSNFMNDLRKNPITPSEIMGLVRGVTANQIVFDKNMKSHLDVLQGIKREVGRLGRGVRSSLTNGRIKKKQKHLTQTELHMFQ